MGFLWFGKKEELLPDIMRIPTDPAFGPILEEYAGKCSKENLALCLSGGGSFGRHEAGFIDYLDQIGILPYVNIVAGTSVGAIIGSVLSLFMSARPLVDLWRSIKTDSDVYSGNLVLSGLTGGLWRAGLLDPRPLYKLIQKTIGELKSQVPMYAIASDFQTRKMAILGPDTNPVDRALSSSAVPGAFPAWKIDDRYYMDGGLIQNIPIPFLLTECAATKVIVLYCSPENKTEPAPLAKAPSAMDTGIAIVETALDSQEEYTDTIIEETEKLRNALGLDPVEFARFWPREKAGKNFLDFANHQALQAGYDDACRYMTPTKLKNFLLA